MGQPTSPKTARKPPSPRLILLRAGNTSDTATERKAASGYDLVVDVANTDPATLRAALQRLSEQFELRALIPPLGIPDATHGLSHSVALLAEELNLPGFSTAAVTTAENRYLSRCRWQKSQLPVTDFALIQFPSAAVSASATIGLPVRFSPIHYGLRHLFANVTRESETQGAYRLVATTLQRHALMHDGTQIINGEDPRTHHHIRFSFSTDLLAVASPPGIPIEVTLIFSNGTPQAVSCTPIRSRRGKVPPSVSRMNIAKMTRLAIEGSQAIGIQTGVICCIIQHTKNGDYLDGIIPNHVDPRIIPMLENQYHLSWGEIVLKTYTSTHCAV